MLRTLTVSLTILAISLSALALGSGASLAPSARMNAVLQPNRSPLVTFRILFMTGSAADPKGKEGVAALTAALLSQGGSRAMTYDQITEAFYPMATSFNWQIDKEMTVFTGTTHLDNLD